MSKPKTAPFPTREQVLEFIRTSPDQLGKREIARAFHITGDQRILLKALLKELEREGAIARGPQRRFARPGAMPEVLVVEISGTDTDGEVLARPLTWEEEGPPPIIYLAPDRAGTPALGIGARVLARLRPLAERRFEARVIRKLAEAPAKVIAVFHPAGDGGGRLQPTDRRHKSDFMVPRGSTRDAVAGELVLAEILPGRRLGLREAKVVDRLGALDNPRAVSLIAIHTHDIPTDFPADALAQAREAAPVTLGSREDLRALPLVTIDGTDARDFDDAVWAEPDTATGGWHLIVAIADVAHYVRPGDPLDRAARLRGNSVYFPDRVVPMLPEQLSNELCSLKPSVDRACLGCHLWITAEGVLKRHSFFRGLMRSAARLTYEQVQAARDGEPDEAAATLREPVIAPLYGAYAALLRQREERGALELDLPERRVVVDEAGRVVRIEPRRRLDSHKLIEEFMIAANVAAAETLESRSLPCMYRVHDQPAVDRVESLRDFLKTLGYSLPKGQVLLPKNFNQILKKAAGGPESQLISDVILRSQAQAVYSPVNLGHFGLALPRYAHFTSPIRRYADVLVHRSLIRALGLGEGGLEDGAAERFAEIGEHISMTERRAATAEREAVDRFTTLFLADRVGAEFKARINGVTRFGLFVTLEETGADGLIPVSTLTPADFYVHDEAHHCLSGKRTRHSFRLGDPLQVILAEAAPITGGLLFHLAGAKAPSRERPTGRERRRGQRSS